MPICPCEQVQHRWPCCIGNRAGTDGFLPCNVYMPQSIATLEMFDFGPGANVCAMLGGIHGVQNDQACVIDPAIRIFKRLHKFRPKRFARRLVFQIYRSGCGQQFPATNMIVQKQAKPHQPRGTNPFLMRQNEAQRPDDMRRNRPKPLAFN